MVVSAGELAKLLQAQLLGNSKLLVETIGEIEDCENPGTIVVALGEKNVEKLRQYKPQLVVLEKDIPELNATKLISSRGKEILAELLNILFPEDHTGFISPQAQIDESAELGINVKIYPGVFIGKAVKIGDNSIIYPNVVIYDYCQIGSNVIIHANAVIGADGFGYYQKEGQHHKIPQKGIVIIGDDVEIGACSTIDRATLKTTIIGQGTKIDNQVHIGHNCNIGKNVILTGGVRIAGSSVLEDGVIVLGGAGISDHVHIGKNSLVSAYTVVTKDFPANSNIYGTPVGENFKEAIKSRAFYNKLPELAERIKKLEKNQKNAD
jgi:UDP-3-O-[3-hydroxymyristoyl] glucosamine N-acyltransferase